MTNSSEIVMTLPKFESSLYGALGEVETAVKNSEFKEMWENSEYLTRYDFFLLCNDILEDLGMPTFDSATLEKGWQYIQNG